MTQILIGNGAQPVHLLAKYGNRHGLVAGATGTGKTVSLMVLAEGFSSLGVPVFIPDVKGDVAGLALAGAVTKDPAARRANRNRRLRERAKPGRVLGSRRKIGPSRAHDDQGLLLLDMDDLRLLLTFVAENRKTISTEYGLVSSQSVGAVQRSLLSLEREGAEARSRSPVGSRYDTRVNRESAHEMLPKRVAAPRSETTPAHPPEGPAAGGGKVNEWLWGTGRRR